MSKKIKIEGSAKKEKWELFGEGKGEERADLLNCAQMEIMGNNQMTIDGCYGVFEYRDTYLRLRLKKGAVIICGENFDIVYFEDKVITIKGKISSVEFCV